VEKLKLCSKSSSVERQEMLTRPNEPASTFW